jgi:hypothetical protein
MTYTNFPQGATSFGVPLVGGVGGVPFTGNWWFVNATTGSDGNASAGTGSTPDAPLATLAQAYSLAAEGNNDVIVLMSSETTSASTQGTFRLSSQLVWAKSALHLVGMTAPTMIGQRARIAPPTTATTNIADLLKVTAQGCYFANFSIFQGVGQSSTAEQLCQITGQRNAFVNVAFQGIASANGAGQAGSYVIKLNGGSENTFIGCQIGTDTESRTAANTSVLFAASATRNIFQDCIFPMYAGASSPFFITAGATSIDRFAWFKNCLFINAIDSAATSITAAVSSNASQGGVILLDNCTLLGASNYSATNGDVNVKISGAVPNGHTSGIALSAATS